MTSKLLKLPKWETEILERSLSISIIPEHHYALISVHGDPSAQLGKDGAGGQNLYVKSLGLSLAKRIIKEYHQGKIFVKHSEVGIGTTIRIILPKQINS